MIKHIIMIKLKDFENKETKQKTAQKLKSSIEKLKEKIHFIEEYEVGLNFCNSPNAYDLVLISAFKTQKELDSYSIHPEHIKVLDFIKEVSAEKKVVDYEI